MDNAVTSDARIIPLDRVKWRRSASVWLTRFASRKPLGALSSIIILSLIVIAVAAPVVAPYDPVAPQAGHLLEAPSSQFFFGTDNIGRDIFSRMVWGARTSLYVGVGSVTIGVLGAVFLGSVSAYFGSWLDAGVQRVVDAMMSIPYILLAMLAVAIVGPGLNQVTFALGFGLVFSGTRVVRSSVLAIRNLPYIEAAQLLGATNRRIIVRHILPNIFAPVMVVATISIGQAIITEATLSFLGLGVPPPDPSWGQMLAGRARQFMYQAPWMAIFPGLAIVVAVFAFNMLGDALRDVLDPRLRGRG